MNRSTTELTAGLGHEADGVQVLLAPAVGLWRDALPAGSCVKAGAVIGRLEILGRLHRVHAPAEAHGVVVQGEAARREARRPVAFGEKLLVLHPQSPVSTGARASDDAGPSAEGLTLHTPSAGRFYRRPAPGAPPFIEVGSILETGQAVALLEVMKTFHRITYEGEGLPPRAEVVDIVPEDESDVEAGVVMLRLRGVD